MSTRLKAGKYLLLSCSALFPVLFAGTTPSLAQAVNLGGAGNLIIPDGRTSTSVVSSGGQTDIRTETVRGRTGFNSFSQFQTGAGTTVNLHLPTQTDTLINVVRDGPAVVEGTLNALKNGSIGGNVVFSDPYGFVLGKNGVINTGGLTINTPTKEYLDRAIDAAGKIDTDATDRLISSDGLPISPDGSVIIRGRVNAEDHVNINAANIAVEGGEKLRKHRRNFEATVNSKGSKQGGALVVRNGRIQLLATGDVAIGGTVSARAKTRQSARDGAGKVTIRAAKNITVTPTARVEALAEIARDRGTDAVAAGVDIVAGGVLDIEGVIAAAGINGAGASVNLSADRAAIKAGALLSSQSADGLGKAAVNVASRDTLTFDGAAEAKGAEGSRLDVRSEIDISLGAGSKFDATGTGKTTKGGDIYVVATRDLAVANGATIIARGTGDADGGFLELSGHNSVNIGAARLDLRSAGTGDAGTLLIDPADITISNASTYVRGAAGSIIDNLGKVEIKADNTITIAAGGMVDSRKSGADALDVTLQAKTITIAIGGSIRADVSVADATAGYKSGNVSLEASDTRIYAALKATAAASIVVAGEVRGGDVSMTAESVAKSSATDAIFDNPAAAVGVMAGDIAFSYLTGLSGGYVAADSTAKVDIRSTAVIAASGDLSIIASGTQVVSNLGINVSKAKPVQMTAFYGELDSVTSAEIQSGARVSVGGNLQVIAKNDALLGVNAMSVSLQDTPVSGAIAVGLSDINTKAIIHSGAVITPAGKVTVLADNTNSFAVTATAMALGNAQGGIGLALQISNAQATARIGADLGTSLAKVGDVSVAAISDTLLNKTQGSTSVGDSTLIGLAVRPLFAASSSVTSTAGSAVGGSAIGSLATEAVKGGFGIAVGIGTQGADASIAADVTPTTSTGVAPKIVSRGNVGVISSVYDSPIRNDANASIESDEQGTGNSTTTTTGVAVSVAVGTFEHTAHATIGQNVSIEAQNVGVAASSVVPVTIAYNNADTPTDMLMAVIGALNGNGGVINNVITSYSATDVASRDIGIAGAVNFLGISHDTLAWVGSNAQIVTTQTSNTSWVAALGSAAARGTEATRTFQAGLDVAAASSTETINIAGNPAWFVVLGGNSAQGGEGSSGGGSLNLNLFSSNTIAGIGDGATVTSAANVHVDAKMSDSIIAIAPSSGKGAAFGVSGLMTYLGIDNQTHSSISNTARIATRAVSVTAHQETLIVSISGALSQSTGTSVGLAATWSTLNTDTSAYVGDNDAEVDGTKDANLTGIAAGEIRANTLDLNASTGGAAYSMSVAAAIAAPEDGKKGFKDKITNKINTSVVGGLSNKLAPTLINAAGGASTIKAFFASKTISALNKVSDKLTKNPASGQTRDFEMAGAGSLSGVMTGFDTAAYIDGATIKQLGNNSSVAIKVDASNDLLISTTSGAGSLALVGQDSAKSSAAVSGAFAVAVSNNQTSARISNTTATDTGSVGVRAIASGQQIVLGLGIAANTNANSSVSIAGSVSIGVSTDGVNALVDKSSLTAASNAASPDMSVLAYQNTDIGIGGLAVSVATKGGGFGLAITATVVTDPSSSKAASARVINSALRAYRNLDVQAITVSRIMSGAGAVAVTPNGLGIQGAIVFNDISPTTLAEVNGDGSQKIALTGNATVRAGSSRDAAIEAELAAVIKNKTIDAGFNFSGTVFGTKDTGAVIFGVAGTVGVGQSNAGFAVQYGGIRHTHEAYLGGVELTTVGNVAVEAKDGSEIFGSAAGVSIGTGGFAGSGSIVVNLIENKTSATIGGANTKVTAGNIAVSSLNESRIGGGAGAVAVSASASGTGLAIIANTIANSTSASVDSATLSATQDILVGAVSQSELMTFAVSVGVGATAGVGGSVATSIALNDAKATVSGATLDAANNVVVAASNSDVIHAVAGAVGVGVSGVGVGLSTVVNIVRGETNAAIGSNAAGTIATIRARGTGNAATIDSGIVKTAFDYAGVDVAKALVALLPDLTNKTIGLSGLSVVAASRQNVGSVSVAVSGSVGGPVAASVSPVVNVLGGKTSASITNASINETGTDGSRADVAVIATSNTFTENVVVSAAFSGGGSLSAGFVSNIMERETTANVSGAKIGSGTRVGDVLVRATGTMDSLNLVAGAAAGAVGGAGSMIVNVFQAKTAAQLAGGNVVARSLTVDADSTTGFLGAAGAGAYGSTAVAGAMNISVNLGSTYALVGEGNRDTLMVLDEDLDVSATSIDKQRAFVVGAAVGGGGGVGVAAMLNLSVLMSDTIASVNRVSAGSTMRDVSVTASNTIELLPVTGGFGISLDGVGVGAAVNLMMTKSSVSSEIVNSAFTATGTLDVKADGLRRIEMITATAGGGSSVGIGAAIGIVVAGIDMSSDASDELHGTLAAANGQANQSTNSRYVADGTPGQYDASKDTKKNVVTDAVGSSKQDSVRARIAASTLTAGATTVVADSKLEISNLAIGLGLGGGAGVGAALGFTVVNQDIAATIDATTTLNVASLSVKALSGAAGGTPAVSGESYAGAGGLAAGVGAAVAVALVESDVTARVAGTVNSANGVGLVQVLAEDKLAVTTKSVGAAAAGGVAVGLSLAVSDRDTTVTASVDDNARIASVAGVGSDFGVAVTATAGGATTASAKAGAGGVLGAGAGASATALDETTVVSRIGKNAVVSGIGLGGVVVTAAATPETHADSLGVAVSGGYAVGASVAYATADITVLAEVGDGASIGSTGGLSVLADVKRAGTNADHDTVYSNAVAGSGALTAAIQATVSEARMTANTTAALGENVTVASAGKAVAVKATTRTRQHADTTGVAVGGLLALGANVAETDSDTTTEALVGDGASITAASLAIKADGKDENRATSVAGGGGIVSGSAAVANTGTTSKTTATLGSGSVSRNVALTGLLDVTATHLGQVSGTVDSVNAGLVGASGAIMLNTVDSTVAASLAENARVAAGNFDLRSVNATHKLFEGETSNGLRTGTASTYNRDGAGWNLNSGSGGLLNLPAGYSQTTITHDTTASLGKNAAIKLAVPAGNHSTANVEAYNEIIAHDKAKLDSGGAIALADTRSILTVSRNAATVSIGEGASIVTPNGNINVAAYDNADLDVRAASTTYGLAGAPSGAAKIDYNRANLVTIAKDAMLEANSYDDVGAGMIRVAAGAGLDGTLSRIFARSTVDLYNNSAIPISTTPDAVTKVSGNSSFLLAGGSATGRGLRSAGDMTIIASKGLIDATAVGTGKDIYREALAALASGVSELFGGGKVSFDYKAGTATVSSVGTAEINGTLLTGIARSKTLTVEYASQDTANCLVSLTACLKVKVDGEIGYTFVDGLPIGSAIIDRIKELGKLLSAYNQDPVASGAFSAELLYLQKKLIALGYSKDGSTGVFGQLSPYEQAQRNIDAYALAVNGLDAQFTTTATTVSTTATSLVGTSTSLSANATSVTTALTSIKAAATDAVTTLKTLGNYNDSANTAANATDLGKITDALSAIDTASGKIATAGTSIATSKGLIATEQANIATKLTLIEQKQTALKNLSSTGTASQIAALKADITTAQGSISTSTGVIETQLGNIDGYTKTISDQKTTINDNIDVVTTAQSQIAARSKKSGDDSKLTALDGFATTIGTGKGAVATQYDGTTGIATNATAVTTAKTALVVPANSGTTATTASGYLSSVSGSRTTFDTTLANEIAGLSGQSKTVANAPTSGQITVDATVARLGDLSITADRLTGTGVLSAPGDASISIVNRTANALVIGNLTIDGDSGGRLRYNGVLVDSNADINRLNQPGSVASFGTITTAVTQGDIRPTILIRNEYNSDSAAYYDPSAAAGSSPYYKTRPFYAPDLTLKSDTSIYNPAGSLVLTSEQGNIYSNSQIEAGSVSITAKNGDFVQSYTYGIDHIAGDPQAGTAKGLGIIANGAVAISARYLNINGVIQSGMAERFVTIGTAPMLTASASTLNVVGVTQSVLNGYDAVYKSDVATAAAGVVVPDTKNLGNGLIYRFTKGETLGQLEFTIDYARTHGLTGKVALVRTDVTASAAKLREIIGVSYDMAADNFVVDGTTVRGGYIQLYGQILNTASSGASLNVLDGYGQIKITNLNSRSVVLGALSTGEDPSGTGRGVRGIIDITDITNVQALGAPAANQPLAAYSVAVTKTVFSRDVVNGVLVAVKDVRTGGLDNSGSFVRGSYVNGAFVASSDQAGYTRTLGIDGRTAEYDPQTGLRYIYLKGVDSSLKTVTEYKGTQFFGSPSLQTKPTGDVVGTPTSYRLKAYDLVNAATVAVSTDATLIGQASATTSTTYNSSDTTYVKTDEWRNCNWWTLCIAASYHYIIEATTPQTTITTTSTKADYAIGVKFIGRDNGLIEVTSLSDILLAGSIKNASGTTTLTSSTGDILQQASGAQIASKNINLSAAGTIGTLDAGGAVKVSLTQSTDAQGKLIAGMLNANAGDGNVVVAATTAIGVGQIIASGDVTRAEGRVVLTAAGSIIGTSSSLIQAPRVELTSTNGSIGSTGSGGLLTVNTGYTTDASLRPFGDPDKGAFANGYYGLKATAAGNIGITSGPIGGNGRVWAENADGTMLIDRVTSLGGNVTLKTAGSILDNNPFQSIDTRTYDQLLSYWNSLGLLAGAANDAKTAAVISAFENSVSAEKLIYAQIAARQPNGGASYDAGFVYTMTSGEKAGFADNLRLLDPSIDTATINQKIADHEAEQTARYHRLKTELSALKGTFDATTGKYTATAAEKAARSTGAVWTERELAFSLSPGALKTITGTNPVIKSANVSGRIVTLEAGKSIGEVASTVIIPTNIAPRDLTDAQKIALATAERSDFVTSAPGTIGIQQTRGVNFDAAESLNVNTGTTGGSGFAYLNSLGDAKLGTINVADELRLKVRGSIVNASATSAAISAGSYILEASNGGIGVSRNLDGTFLQGTLRIKPLDTSALGKGTIIARAADAVNLRIEGNANIDTVYSRSGVTISASKSIRNANSDDLINVLGDSVVLTADDGAIGSAGDRLNVGNAPTGTISATATQDIALFVPAGQRGTLGTMSAGSKLDILSALDLLVDGQVSAVTSTVFKAGGQFAIGALGSINVSNGGLVIVANAVRMLTGATATVAGAIDVAATGDAQVTGLTSASNDAKAIKITAGGSILAGTAPSRTDLTTTAAGAGIFLNAGTGIGDRTVANTTLADVITMAARNALVIHTAQIDATADRGNLALESQATIAGGRLLASDGNIDLVARADSRLQSIAALTGDATIIGEGALTLGPVRAGGGVTIDGAKTLALSDVLSRTQQLITSEGDLSFGTLRTLGMAGNAGDVTLMSKSGFMSGNTIDAHGALRLDADQSIQVTTTSAGGDINANAGTKLTVGTMQSVGSQRLAAGGEIGFGRLMATGLGDVTLSSRNGSLRGTVIDATGAVSGKASGEILIDAVSAAKAIAFDAQGGIAATTITTGDILRLDAARSIQVSTAAVGGSIDATAGKSLTIGSMSSGGSQQLAAGDELRFGQLTTTGKAGDLGNVFLSSRRASIVGGTIDASGLFVGAAAGDISLDHLEAASAGLVAQGSILAKTIATQSALRMNAGRMIEVRTATVGGSVDLMAGGDVTAGSMTSAGSQRLTAGGDLRTGRLTTTGMIDDDGAVTLSSLGASINIDTVEANGEFTAAALRNIELDRLDAASAVIAAQGSILAETIGTESSLRLDAGKMTEVTTALVGSSISATAGDGLTAGSMTSTGSQRLTAGGDLRFGQLTTTGMEGDLGAVTLASRNASIIGGSIDANGVFDAMAQGNIQLDRLHAAEAGFSAKGDIGASSIATDGALRLDAAKSIQVTTTTAAGSVDATAGESLRVSSMVSGGSQRLTAGGDLVFDMLRTLGIAGDIGNVDLKSLNGAVLGGTVDAHGRLQIAARSSLVFDRLVAGGDLGIKAGGPVRGSDLTAGGEMSFDFGGSDPIHLKTVRSRALNFSSEGALSIDQAYAGISANFAVPNLSIGALIHTIAGAPLAVSIDGFDGSLAENVSINFVSPDGIAFSKLHAIDSRFTTTGDFVSVADGYVPGSLRLQTPDRVVWMNNRRQTPVLSADTQLYAPNFSFGLIQEGKATYTDSFVVRNGPGSQIHFLSGGQDYLGASFIKDFERWMQNPARQQSAMPEETSLTRKSLAAIMSLFRSSDRGSVVKSLDGPAVNLTAASSFEQP